VTAVDHVLRAVAPDRRVESVERPARGNAKETAVVRFAASDSVVVHTGLDPRDSRTEAALLAAIAERTEVPVPTLVAAGECDGEGYLVTDFVAGAELHERFVDLPADRRRSLARAFGTTLASLHEAFPFESAGPLSVDPSGSLVAAGQSSVEQFEAYAESALAALPAAFSDLRPAIEASLTAPETARQPRLFPWDLRPGNALLDPGDGLAAVLDWGEPLAADPALALAKTEHLVTRWYGVDADSLEAAFRAGYESVRPRPEVPVAYRVAAVVEAAVDSAGEVTRPGFPERTGADAVAAHRAWLDEWVADGESE
jgi:aminoglycoside phosphotransferase (APT) family kinase protein